MQKDRRTNWKTAILLFLVVAMLPQAYAYIDLATPAANSFIQNSNVTFDYYPSMPGNIEECSLEVNDEVLIVNTQIDNSDFNSFSVVNMPDGAYDWKVMCTNNNSTEESDERSFTLDSQEPMVNLIYPINGTNSTSSIDVKFIVNDNIDSNLDCSIEIDGQSEAALQASRNTEKTRTLSPETGNHEVEVKCTDDAGNEGVSGTRLFTASKPITFEISLDKHVYNIGEPVDLYVNAPQNTNVSLEICPDGEGFVECYSSIEINGQTYPRNEILPTTNKSGTYFIDAYFKHPQKTETKRITYSVDNNLGAEIEGDTSLRKGESVTYRAIGHGGKSPLSYEWTLHNGTKVSGDVVTIKYPQIGSFTEILKVTDAAGNEATETVNVEVVEAYEVTVTVTDSDTDAPLQGVAVELDNMEEATGTDGKAFFTARKGSLDLIGFLSGYELYESKVSISTNSELEIRLKSTSNSTPSVQLLTPGNDQEASVGEVGFRFRTSNSDEALCRLMMKGPSDDSYKEKGSVQAEQGIERVISVNLQAGEYSWRVTCEAGSTTFESGTRTARIVEGEVQTLEATTQVAESSFDQNSMLASLGEVIQSYSRMGSKEREFSEIVGIQDEAKNALKLVQRSARDIHDLRYRTNMNDEQKENQRNEIIENTTSKYKSIIKSIDIKETRSFVNYPEAEDLVPVAEAYARMEELDMEAEELAEVLKSLQNLIVVSTKAYVAEIERMDGRKETWTAITKKVKYDDAARGNYILEYVPKSIASTADEIIFLGEYEVVEEDPVLRLELGEDITYYVRRKADIEEARNTQTVLARDNLADGLSKATGSVAFFPSVEVNSKGFLTVLAILLLLIYAFYESSLWKKASSLITSKADDKHTHYIRVLVNDALDNLEADNYDKSSLIYREIKLSYENLPGRIRKEVHPDIVNLVNRMDIYYSRDVSEQIEKAIEEGDMNRAHLLYSNLQGTYKKLDPDYKKEIYDKIVKIAGRLKA